MAGKAHQKSAGAPKAKTESGIVGFKPVPVKKTAALAQAERLLRQEAESLKHFIQCGGSEQEEAILVLIDHSRQCVELLSRIVLQNRHREARFEAINTSLHLAKVVDLAIQNSPDGAQQFSTKFQKALRAWIMAGEIFTLSNYPALKLKEQPKLGHSAATTRIVIDFLMLAEASGSCKNLPPLCPATFGQWWERVLKPFLERPEMLDTVKEHYPAFFRNLESAAKERGSTRDSMVKNELKKRCKAALRSIAAARSMPS